VIPTSSALLEAPDVMLSVAASVPTAFGLKITVMLQVLPPASDAGQPDPRLNCVLAPLVTVRVTGPIPTALLLMLVKVTALLEDVPSFTVPKARLVGLTLIGAKTVSVMSCCAGEDTPFDASIQKENTPATVGVPLSVPVPLWLSTNFTPAGSDPPFGDSVSAGVGIPIAVTVNEFDSPSKNVILSALVMTGG